MLIDIFNQKSTRDTFETVFGIFPFSRTKKNGDEDS